MLAVPKVHILYKGRDQDEHLRLMGYKRLEQAGDAKTGNAGPQWEATDDYASRMQGLHDVLWRSVPERAAREPLSTSRTPGGS